MFGLIIIKSIELMETGGSSIINLMLPETFSSFITREVPPHNRTRFTLAVCSNRILLWSLRGTNVCGTGHRTGRYTLMNS